MFDGLSRKSHFLVLKNTQKRLDFCEETILLFCNTFCFYRMPPVIIFPFHLKKENTNAQRDVRDINFSLELKGKAHASTKLPFGFEGRTIFPSEPKQNFKGVQHWRPKSPLKARCQCGGMGG